VESSRPPKGALQEQSVHVTGGLQSVHEVPRVSALRYSNVGQVRFWSWFQLYADFQAMYPSKGPWFNSKKLQWESRQTMPKELFVRRTRWLTTYLMNLAKQLGFQLPVEYRLPHSHVIHYWLNTLPVQVAEERCLEADRWLQEWRQIFTHSKQLRLIA
jgi:hypothetical protein